MQSTQRNYLIMVKNNIKYNRDTNLDMCVFDLNETNQIICDKNIYNQEKGLQWEDLHHRP